MRLNIKCRVRSVSLVTGILFTALLTACMNESSSAPSVSSDGTVATQEDTAVVAEVTNNPPFEVIVYASDLPQDALFELDFMDDSASPSGKLIGLPNTGDELDPPPESDPHLTFEVPVQAGIPYRCWIHMKVGTPKGRSQANVIWVQFSDAVDESNREVLKLGTGSYLTVQGPTQPGWTWVACNFADSMPAGSLIYFRASGEITVQLQAGAEGVGFDQFVLSPLRFLEEGPLEPIVVK